MRRVKHKRLTEAQWTVLEREADRRELVTRNKVLAEQLGMTELYVAQVISGIRKERAGRVPRATHIFALEAESDSEAQGATGVSREWPVS